MKFNLAKLRNDILFYCVKHTNDIYYFLLFIFYY